MKPLLLFLALLVSVIGVSQNVKADERNYYYHPEYNWNHEYWHHHHYGYWHHHRGYWRFRHGEHIFIRID
jgi:hypothetical protein